MSGVSPATPESLPPAADARVRRMRVARDACWVIVAASLGAAGLVLLDAVVRMPGWGRGLGLAVWVTAVGVLAWRLFLRRWEGGPTPKARAAKAELPNNLRAATAAALSLVGCLLAGSLVPGAGEHLRRVALPWQRPALAPYWVMVTSGEPVVRRGDSVTLSGYAEKTDPAAATPDTATLICRAASGTEVKFPMSRDGTGAFHATRPAVVGFEYRVEIGNATSDWFAVSVLDPAEVAAGSVIEVLPPAYAPAAARRSVPGFVAFHGFQHGTAELRLRFTRPVSTAFVEWRPEGGQVELPPVTFAADRLALTTGLRLTQGGALRLITFTEEHGKSLRWERSIAVRVKPDEPPRFERLSGVWVRAVRPGERLPIELTATDDIAVGAAVLEYVAGPADATPIAVSLPLVGAGTAKAESRLDFDLAGKGRAGEAVRFRLRVADTRRLDEAHLKPQEAVFPETGWLTVRIDPAAGPPEHQDITGQRDAIREVLTEALEETRRTREEAAELDKATDGKTALTVDQTTRLRNAQERTRKAAGKLLDAAAIAALTPDLRPLAAALLELAGDRFKNADAALGKAVTENPADRTAALSTALTQLSVAQDRVEELAGRNDRLARDRLDRATITAIAIAQLALADRAAPEANVTPEELARLQMELLARLRKVVAESEPLRTADTAARAAEFRRFVVAANELAERVRELDAAAKQLTAEARKVLVGAIIAEHAEVAKKTAALLARIETAARLASVSVPRGEDFRRIADLMAEGKSLEALTDLEKFAQGLEAVAVAFEKQAADRADPKTAARQLALWQDDLLTRFRSATDGKSAGFATLPDATKTAFRSEQVVLRAAAAVLKQPPGDYIKTARERAEEHLTAASSFLAGSGAGADAAMRKAADALGQLADKIPTVSDRLIKVRREFETLRSEQDAIQVAAEQALKGADPTPTPGLVKKLMPALDRQRKQLTTFAALDLPVPGGRRERVLAALNAAATDLEAGSPLDVAASQEWVRREFARLKLVLDGQPPPDDRADDLARRLNRVIAALGPTPTDKQVEGQAGEVQEIVRQFDKFLAPEAPALLNDAQITLQAVGFAFRTNPKPDEVVRLLKPAAAAMDRLADRLCGAESDVARVKRLAANRRAGAAEAEKVRDAKPPATNTALAEEIVRQLGRESEELSQTRVGAAGQVLKKRVLDEFDRLKKHMNPEKMAGLHAKIADGLKELADLMKDVPELNVTFDRNPPAAVPADADAFLPSKSLADALRDLARQQRTIHARLTNLPADVVARTKPAEGNGTAALVEKQRELARQVLEYADRLDAAARDTGPEEPAGKALREAAKGVRAAERVLGEAATKTGDGAAGAAEKLRAAAGAGLANVAVKLAGAAPELITLPEPAELARGEALLAAEAAMRQAIGQLGKKPDRAAAGKAMRTAGEELKKVAKGE